MNHSIDVHAHYQPRRLNAFMGRFERPLVLPQMPWTDLPGDIEERLRLMEGAKVRIQILSPGTARIINDDFSSLAERYPARLAAYASLPMPHIDASLRELERALRLPGMVGVTLHCSILDKSVADPEFEPVYEELNRRHAILFLHPCRNGICSSLVNDYQLAESVGTLVEDSLAAIHMIVRRIPSRYPNIRVIVPHLGGLLPMILNRLDNQLVKAEPHRPTLVV
jgi:predicted TIM-barrel fold metal-dependent hydrolase